MYWESFVYLPRTSYFRALLDVDHMSRFGQRLFGAGARSSIRNRDDSDHGRLREMKHRGHCILALVAVVILAIGVTSCVKPFHMQATFITHGATATVAAKEDKTGGNK